VFENRMLRRIFGPKRDRVTGGCRKLHSEELYNAYSYPNSLIVILIKSRRVRWVRYVARMGIKIAFKMLVGKRPPGKLGVGGSRIILKWVLRKEFVCALD
jgi:hypothetical protein